MMHVDAWWSQQSPNPEQEEGGGVSPNPPSSVRHGCPCEQLMVDPIVPEPTRSVQEDQCQQRPARHHGGGGDDRRA